jgi:hypothetical protein
MLIASTTDEDGDRFILFGLSAENLRRLQDGMPIKVTRALHGLAMPPGLTIVLIAGETEATIEADLRTHGLIGPGTVVNQKAPL